MTNGRGESVNSCQIITLKGFSHFYFTLKPVPAVLGHFFIFIPKQIECVFGCVHRCIFQSLEVTPKITCQKFQIMCIFPQSRLWEKLTLKGAVSLCILLKTTSAPILIDKGSSFASEFI